MSKSTATVMFHLNNADTVRTVVRSGGAEGRVYAEVHLGEDFTVFADEAGLIRLRSTLDIALAGVAEVARDVAEVA